MGEIIGYEFGVGAERQLAKPELSPDLLRTWLKECRAKAESYRAYSSEEQDQILSFLIAYESFIKQNFAAKPEQDLKGLTGAEQDKILAGQIKEYLRSADGETQSQAEGKPVSVQDFLELMSRDLQERIKQHAGLESLCRDLGIVYEKIPEVLAPTHGTRPVQTGSGAGLEKPPYISKAHELVDYLLRQKLFGQNLIIQEGTVRKEQMRDFPYCLVEIPALGKQILICEQLGEAAFVSHIWLGKEVFAKADKYEFKEGYGMTKVSYDRQGRWLEKVKELLLETPKDFSEDEVKRYQAMPPDEQMQFLLSRKQLDVKAFAETRKELLDKYPTSKEFIEFMASLFKIKQRDESRTFLLATIKTLTGKVIQGRPTKKDMLESGFVLYGSEDPNLTYLWRVENNDAEYFIGVVKNGLPQGGGHYEKIVSGMSRFREFC